MRIIGVTGSIGMGKTTVANKLAAIKNAAVFNADKTVHFLYKQPTVIIAINDFMGINSNHIDRQQLAEYLFNSGRYGLTIERYIHHLILKKLKLFINLNKYRKKQVVILDIPLLFESDFHKYCTDTIAVYCNKYIQLERLKRRHNYNRNLIETILNRQFSSEKKRYLADYSINTGWHLSTTQRQLYTI